MTQRDDERYSSNQDAQAARTSPREPYVRPKLSVYGQLPDLTYDDSGKVPDGFGSWMPAP